MKTAKSIFKKDWKNIHQDFTPELKKEWKEKGFSYEECKEWIDIGLKVDDAEFVNYLKEKGKTSEWCLNYGNIRKLREKYNSKEESKKSGKDASQKGISAQEWLDQHYPQKERIQVEELDVNKENLEGELNLTDFSNLKKLSCENNKLTSLNLSNCQQLKIINCRGNQLTNLDLTNLSQLQILSCLDNKLTNLIITNCSNLSELNCSKNHLTNLKSLLNNLNPQELKKLLISVNNFRKSDLTLFSKFVNLKTLCASSSRLTGSLVPLKNCTKLEFLDIEGNDLTSGLKHLPESLRSFSCHKGYLSEQLKGYERKTEYGRVYYDYQTWKKANQALTQEKFREEVEEWIRLGLQLHDYNFIKWLKEIKKLTPDANNLELRELINNQIIRTRINVFGWCENCYQPNTGANWCLVCKSREVEISEWTSGNQIVDDFIKEHQKKAINEDKVLRWMPYGNFTSEIKEIAQGGYGRIYKTKWRNKKVVLKSLYKSNNLTDDLLTSLLQEIARHKLFDKGKIVQCYGISQHPETKEYIMVMEYISGGSLREYSTELYSKEYEGKSFDFNGKTPGFFSSETAQVLKDILLLRMAPAISPMDPAKKEEFIKAGLRDLNERLMQIFSIVQGLKEIHQQKLIHKDLHPGNILKIRNYCFITDLGLSSSVEEIKPGKVFGVLPYVAPEVLQGKPYTQAADIYSFGMVAYELLTDLIPFGAEDWNELANKVREGYRPLFQVELDGKVWKMKIPQLLKGLIKRCWSNNPGRRPTILEIEKETNRWTSAPTIKQKEFTGTGWNPVFDEQRNEWLKHNRTLPSFSSLPIHHTVCLTSKIWPTSCTSFLLDFSNPPQFQNNLSSQGWQASTSLELQIKSIEEEIKLLKDFSKEEQKKLVEEFIEFNKKLERNEDDEEIMDEVGKLYESLEKEGISKKDIEKIIYCCEKLVELEKQLEKKEFQTQIEIPPKK